MLKSLYAAALLAATIAIPALWPQDAQAQYWRRGYTRPYYGWNGSYSNSYYYGNGYYNGWGYPAYRYYGYNYYPGGYYAPGYYRYWR